MLDNVQNGDYNTESLLLVASCLYKRSLLTSVSNADGHNLLNLTINLHLCLILLHSVKSECFSRHYLQQEGDVSTDLCTHLSEPCQALLTCLARAGQGREARVQELVRNKETRGDWERGTRSLCDVPIPGSCQGFVMDGITLEKIHFIWCALHQSDMNMWNSGYCTKKILQISR